MIVNAKFKNYKIIGEDLYKMYNKLEKNNFENEEEALLERAKWQDNFIDKNIKSKKVILHFLEDTAFCDESYYDCVKDEITRSLDMIAIKDGVNLVQFENGNYGFIAYYSGNENGFEIIENKEEF